MAATAVVSFRSTILFSIIFCLSLYNCSRGKKVLANDVFLFYVSALNYSIVVSTPGRGMSLLGAVFSADYLRPIFSAGQHNR